MYDAISLASGRETHRQHVVVPWEGFKSRLQMVRLSVEQSTDWAWKGSEAETCVDDWTGDSARQLILPEQTDLRTGGRHSMTDRLVQRTLLQRSERHSVRTAEQVPYYDLQDSA